MIRETIIIEGLRDGLEVWRSRSVIRFAPEASYVMSMCESKMKTKETTSAATFSAAQRPVHNSMAEEAYDPLFLMQKTLGNQFVQQWARKGIQRKIKISQANDIYEQEADRVANQVMPMPGPCIQRKTEIRQKSGYMIARQERGKPVIKPKGIISYKKHESFIKKKLSTSIESITAYITGTKVGNDLVEWLESHGINVTVFFVAESENIPDIQSNTAAGYFKEVGSKKYHVYVVAGLKSGDFIQIKTGSLEWKEKIVNLDTESISNTLFHELLHVWFVNRYPEADIETGHTAKVEPEVKAFGVTTYDEKEYDSNFLKKLKEFDAQLKKFIEEKKKVKEK
jgi:hypothetical protein